MRSFWETYVNLVFICQKPEIRSNQFNLDELQKYLGRRYIILKYINKETKETIKVQINKTQKEIEKVKEYLKKIDSNTDYEKFKWKSISAEEKAKELDLTKEYELLYRNWSESAHPSSTTGQDYLNIKGSIVKAIMPSEFNGRMIPERILLLSQGLIKTLSLIYKEFELKPEYKFLNKKILDKLTSHYNTLNPEI
ncbi:MAG: hypothetical protein KAW92_10970 [Candidatus Cloacimonetes bacterium]|nr:hypothetical protein [Candidatus Cloacimonadota bacterium]